MQIFVTDKGLVSKIYTQLMTFNSIKTNNPLKKYTGDLNRHFSNEDIQMAKNPMDRGAWQATVHSVTKSRT